MTDAELSELFASAARASAEIWKHIERLTAEELAAEQQRIEESGDRQRESGLSRKLAGDNRATGRARRKGVAATQHSH
jgi:hypothetical protein